MQMNCDASLPAGTRLLSIGHSNHELTRFFQLLQAANVTAIADVRSQPFSQRYPQYNRPELQRALDEQGIVYAFLGDHLGGRPRQLSLYDGEGRVDYERVRQTAIFREGLDRLIQALDDHVVAMLCSEEDPMICHRGLMIAPALVERGIKPAHLRGDASAESTTQFEERLLAETKVGAGIFDGLFAAAATAEERRDLLREAYRRQALRKAFRLRPGSDAAAGEPDEDSDDPQ